MSTFRYTKARSAPGALIIGPCGELAVPETRGWRGRTPPDAEGLLRMQPSEWARQTVERLAQHHRLIWVEDPYQLIEPQDLHALRPLLSALGHSLVVAENAFRLREQLQAHDPSSAALVVVDQAFIVREPHLLPKDAKPADLRPMPAPDWKPLVDPQALFRPTVQSFLEELTGERVWPSEVNLFPYEKLARERTADFVTAWESFHEMARVLTTNDLLAVGASAVLGLNLFSLADPFEALALAFRAQRWDELENHFNRHECDVIRARLRELPRPLGDLFTEKRDTARLAVAALAILQQHFDCDAGQHLGFLSSALAAYADCAISLSPGAAPSWFVETEIPAFEKIVEGQPGFLEHLRGVLALDTPEKRTRFGRNERYSDLLRDRLAPFEQERKPPEIRGHKDFSLGELIPRFVQAKREMAGLVSHAGRALDALRLTAPRDLTLKRILGPFVEGGLCRADLVAGEIDNLIRDIDGPARPAWEGIPEIEQRWRLERQQAREDVASARKTLDSYDVLFGRCLESRYAELTPGELPSTDHLYEKYMGPRRRQADGRLKKAVVLVFDSLRFDLWRELVRPALEQDYVVDESLALARLPSETRVSRRAFFAGCPPGMLPTSGAETEHFARLLSRIHGIPTVFSDADKRSGMAFAARSTDGLTYTTVFDFADALSHELDWDIHTLRDVQRALLRQVRAVLQEAGKEAVVFVTADHGHIFQAQGAPIPIDSPDGVGYRSAWVPDRIQGQHAPHLFQILARTLGHGRDGWYVFPKPGFALRDATRPFRPAGSYRHGGLSLFEVMIPVACLRHREARVAVRLVPSVTGRPVVGEPATIQIAASADGVLTTAVTISAENPGFTPVIARDLRTTPKTFSTTFVPATPGRQTLRLSATLGAEALAQASLDLDVAPAAAGEPEDKAREKLRRLFGED